MSTYQRIVEDVLAERARQLDLWGNQSHIQPDHHLRLILEEVGEVAREINDGKATPGAEGANYRTELIQTAALCFAAVRNYDDRVEARREQVAAGRTMERWLADRGARR